ncbi:MAG: TPM domain-containing protein [Acidobacteria bacterium]|nr:TPM domain-containing protein [Acidobacteriota bacterium]
MRLSLRAAAAALALGCAGGGALAEFQVPPAPPRFVLDAAGLLDDDGRRALEDRVLQLNAERGLQIGVGIFPSLEGEEIEDVSIRIAEAWQPGFKGRDDGLLLTVFLQEKKVRIEVGYGLEGAIPDITAGRIIREQIAPAFRQRDYAGGLMGAVNALAAAAENETLPPPRAGAARGEGDFPVAALMFVVLIVALSVFQAIARRAVRRRTLNGRMHSRDDLPLWLLLLLGSSSSSSRRRGGGWHGGGFGGGGGFFGGGGGSFGGGSFGGGGASGGW